MSADSYVFIGPTITEAEAQQWLKAVYLPPVSQGDIISLLRYQPKIIGIIDGYFERVPSVWHKEILLALSQGIHVVGGASLGALRAAELHPFGMVGVGQVFEWYRDGYIEADDEVAVRHAPASHQYYASSEALVNIRKTLQVATETGLISWPTQAKLIALGQRLHYGDRSYSTLLQQAVTAGLPQAEIERLQLYLPQGRIDQKKQDAVAVLRYIANLANTSPPLAASFNLHHTSKLSLLLDKDFCLGIFDGIRLTADMLINHLRLESNNFVTFKERTNQSKNLLQVAQQRHISLNAIEQTEAQIDFRTTVSLTTPAEVADWMAQNLLTKAEFEQLVIEWGLVRKMKSSPGGWDLQREPNNQDFIRQLRWEGQFKATVKMAIAKETLIAEITPPELTRLDKDELYAFFVQRKQSKLPQYLEDGAAVLGFNDQQVFVLELIKYYYYHQHS